MRLERVLTLALLALAGCATVPERTWETKTFELPFVHDYDVVNWTSFAWRDDFLSTSSFAYSQRVAGPLSALAAGVYGYRGGMDRHALAELGFNADSLFRRYGRDIDPADPVYGKDQVGFTLATKRVVLDGVLRDVIFILVRGTFGRDEWLSNLNCCNSWGLAADPDPAKMPALHEGFRKAADAVQAAAEAYAASNHVDLVHAKIVVTGHSRGGAVANLLGARIDDGRMFAGACPSNAFVYAFAPPNTVLDERVDCGARRYGNIFNIVNPEDMVPLVPLARWRARRYGVDLFLRNYDELSLWEVWTDSAYNDMKDEFRQLTGYEWWHTPFGTNSTHVVPAILGAVAPTVPDLYAVPPDQRAAGNLTSIHSIFETLIYRCMDASETAERRISLGGDVKNLTTAYSTVNEGESPEQVQKKSYFYTPDGRDFSRQPGIFDIPWRMTCMHATQTYIGWMKAAERHGPAAVYKNWHDVGH